METVADISDGPREPFWLIMRLSNSSKTLQQVDSLPHTRHYAYGEALAEAARLCKTNPNAKGFGILKCVAVLTPVKDKPAENTFSQRIKSLERDIQALKKIAGVEHESASSYGGM